MCWREKGSLPGTPSVQRRQPCRQLRSWPFVRGRCPRSSQGEGRMARRRLYWWCRPSARSSRRRGGRSRPACRCTSSPVVEQAQTAGWVRSCASGGGVGGAACWMCDVSRRRSKQSERARCVPSSGNSNRTESTQGINPNPLQGRCIGLTWGSNPFGLVPV